MRCESLPGIIATIVAIGTSTSDPAAARDRIATCDLEAKDTGPGTV
jgi:hypothetical protein